MFVSDLADLANSYKNVLSADKSAQYDQIIDIDLNKVSGSWPQGYKTFFMLKSAVHEI